MFSRIRNKMTAPKRLQMDLRKITTDPPPGISASPCDDNIMHWKAMISGPEDTPFEGGVFRLRLKFSADYPKLAPAVWFYSKMYHPNVYADGKICLDILEEPDKWTEDYDVSAVLCAIQSLLGDPNPGSPANGHANGLFIRDKDLYEKTVRQFVSISNEETEMDEEVNYNEETEGQPLKELEDNLATLDLTEFGDNEAERQKCLQFLRN